jgi:UDP-glucose 4-epimerase
MLLIVGGGGFVGSHLAQAFHRAGHDVLVLDDDSASITAVAGTLNIPWVTGNLGDAVLIEQVLSGSHPCTRDQPVTGLIHAAMEVYLDDTITAASPVIQAEQGCAATLVKAWVQECQRRHRSIPLLLTSCAEVYASSASSSSWISESAPLDPVTPQAYSRRLLEQLMARAALSNGLPLTVLRCFSPLGADPTGLIGERRRINPGILHSMFNVFAGRSPALEVDADAINPHSPQLRDYVHVCDLADAHVRALEHLEKTGGVHVFNLGRGIGTSLPQLIAIAEQSTGNKLSISTSIHSLPSARVLISDSSRAEEELGWKPRHPQLSSMISHAWAWYQNRYGLVHSTNAKPLITKP